MKTKAIILAAGFGTRMKEYSKELPKPMLPIGDKPMIEYTIRHLAAHGITEIAMNLHYHANKITDYFGDGKKFGVNLTYVHESAPSGTAGGVKKLASFCQSAENIIVIYGDIITDIDYSQFILAHKLHDKTATICIHNRLKSNSIIAFDESLKITSFIERPTDEVLNKYQSGIWVNSAIYCFKPSILNYIKDGGIQDFPKDIFPELISTGELYAHKLTSKRHAIDSEEKYLLAIDDIKNFHFAF